MSILHKLPRAARIMGLLGLLGATQIGCSLGSNPTSPSSKTATPVYTKTPTAITTYTPTNNPTSISTNTPTSSYTPLNTATCTPTPTDTNTPTSTLTPINTITPTYTPTPTNSYTPTLSPTNTDTPTNTYMPTNTATATNTCTITPTPTETPIPATKDEGDLTLEQKLAQYLSQNYISDYFMNQSLDLDGMIINVDAEILVNGTYHVIWYQGVSDDNHAAQKTKLDSYGISWCQIDPCTTSELDTILDTLESSNWPEGEYQ